jgi:tRNA (cmo5U34)-methyltransferase
LPVAVRLAAAFLCVSEQKDDAMAHLWQQDVNVNQFVGARRHLPCMAQMFDAAMRYIRAMADSPRSIVDLGCGTGVTGGAMLDAFPGARLTLNDFSQPMLEQARARYGGDDRVSIVHADLGETGVMRRICPEPVDLVVSSLAIHHLPRGRQMSLYAEVYEALVPGGVFVNIEHVASASERIETMFKTWMYESVAASRMADGVATTVDEVRREFEQRRHVNILTPVCTQLSWLRDIGFTDVDCFFKTYELAAFGGRRNG